MRFADAGHEDRVDAQPGGECEQAVHLTALRAHRRDRRVAPDHRHDALVLVLERLRRASGEIGEQVVGGPGAGLQRDGAELGQRLAVGAGDVRDVADHVQVREALHREVVLHVDPPAASLRHARPSPPAPAPVSRRAHTTHLVLISVPSPSFTCPGATSVDLGVEVQLHPLAREARARHTRALFGENGPSRWCPRSTRWIRAARDLEVVVFGGHRPRDHVRQRARRLDARRAAADDDEVERAALDQRGVAVGGLEHGEDPGAQPGRVFEGVQRERVLLGAGRAEEVRAATPPPARSRPPPRSRRPRP